MVNFKIPLWNYNPITIIQQHLIIRRYSCRHCQRIDFTELSTSHHGHSGFNGPQNGINDPDIYAILGSIQP